MYADSGKESWSRRHRLRLIGSLPKIPNGFDPTRSWGHEMGLHVPSEYGELHDIFMSILEDSDKILIYLRFLV